MSKKNSLFDTRKSESELTDIGKREAQRQLTQEAREGKLMRPLISYERLKSFSVKKIREAMNGQVPTVDYLDIDTC